MHNKSPYIIKFFIVERPKFTSVVSPPINSLKKEFAFIKAYIEPIYNNCEKKLLGLYSSENVISKIKDTNICKNKSDKNVLHHDLKIQLNLSIERDKIANGHNNIKTRIMTYLRE